MATRIAVEDRAAAFEADLLAGPTATAVLERWSGGRVHAEVVESGEGYRRVRLMRGGVLLSEAENRFDPEALTPEMRAALVETETPFGVVIAPLMPHREVTSLERLSGERFLSVRAHVFAADGSLLAEVSEVYRAAVLDFLRSPAKVGVQGNERHRP